MTDTHSASTAGATGTAPTNVRDVLQRLVRENKRLNTTVDSLQREQEILREEMLALRRHNSRLATSAFLLMAWQNDNLATVAGGTDAMAEAAQAWIRRFSEMQAEIAPETFRRFYGVDPVSGAELGDGVLTTGQISTTALAPHLEDVPLVADAGTDSSVRSSDAGEMGRVYRDNGALDNK